MRLWWSVFVAPMLWYSQASAEELSFRMPPQAEVVDARRIADYRQAVDAIVQVMVTKFDLPVPRGSLQVYTSREEFEEGLIRYLKVERAVAHSASEFSKAAVGSYTLLVNAPQVAGLTWPERIELMAHELTHNVQLTLANRPGIARPQWLIEGFAEWMAFNVTDALGLDDVAAARERMIRTLRGLRAKQGLPRLIAVDTFADWVETRRKYGFDATYPLAFVMTDFLVQRHSLAAVKRFFEAFRRSQDPLANFRNAFGEEPEAFDRALQAHLDKLLGG
ncbi:MAG TPA: hypothetical protein VHP37_25520 [Burkholderiales bacterium]|nr:hypothetical protein [Burkholderiales bacterium]